jgi:hypothetical protein
VFGLGLATKIYVAVEAVDMRKYVPSMVMWSRPDQRWKNLGGNQALAA